MSRRRSGLAKLSRTLYLASRTASDVQAARNGRLGQRLVRRVYHRKLVGLLRRGRLW